MPRWQGCIHSVCMTAGSGAFVGEAPSAYSVYSATVLCCEVRVRSSVRLQFVHKVRSLEIWGGGFFLSVLTYRSSGGPSDEDISD